MNISATLLKARQLYVNFPAPFFYRRHFIPAYLIAQIRFTADHSAFTAYRDAVGPLSHRFGGRYLVAGGAKVEVLEGAHDSCSLVIFEFPSIEQLHAFWDSPDYAQVKKLREGLERFLTLLNRRGFPQA